MQIVDLLIGAIGYENRKFPDGFKKSEAKQQIIDLIKRRYHSVVKTLSSKNFHFTTNFTTNR